MKVRTILATVALCAVMIGIWSFIEYSNTSRRAALGISMELARKMMGPSGVNFKLSHTSFLDSFARDKFYVVMEFKNPGAGDKLQEVFFFDAFGGKPQMEWSYSVLNNLAKLKVSEGTFIDAGNAQIERKGQGFEMPIALTPVEWNFQGETIERLGHQGVPMLVSVEEHPELKPFRIDGLTDSGDCLAEFPSKDDALYCAKVLEIKLTN